MRHGLRAALLILVTATPLVVAPAEARAQSPVTFAAETSLKSRYLFAGIPFSTDWVQQLEVSANRGGFTVYGFTTFDYDLSEVIEADVYADWYTQLSPTVGFFVGGALYNFDFGPAGGGWQGTQEIYAGVSFATVLNPTLLVAHDFELGDGTHALLGISHAIPIGSGGVTLDLGGNIDYNAEYWTTQSGLSYADASAGLTLPLGPLTLQPGVLIQRRLSDDFAGFVIDAEVFVLTAAIAF